MRHSSLAGIMLLPLALLIVSCRSENSNHSNAPVKATGSESHTTAQTAPTTTMPDTPTQAPPTAPTPATAPVADGAAALPISDAVAFRDRLLAIAQNLQFNPQASAAAHAGAIRAAWQQQFPKLKFSIFYSMVATPDTVSSSDTFLISGSGAAGNYDQLYAFAVADTKGNCAGGAAVIPGDNTNRKVSDKNAPTVFMPIAMSNAEPCTGKAAGENYKP